jgi:hypothetical protein
MSQKIWWVFGALGLLGVLLIGGLVAIAVWVLATGLGTNLDRSDFRTEHEALDFVSSHLPAPLPAGASVTQLDYSRFTDWHLAATVEFASPAAAEAYLAAAAKRRDPGLPHCTDGASRELVFYSLAKWHACGRVQVHAHAPRQAEIECATQ